MGNDINIQPPSENQPSKESTNLSVSVGIRAKKWIIPAFLLLLLTSFSVNGFLAYQNQQLKQKRELSLPTPTPTEEVFFRKTRYLHMAVGGDDFSYEYPHGWHVRNYFDNYQGKIRNLLEMDPNPLTLTDYKVAITGTQNLDKLDENTYVDNFERSVQEYPDELAPKDLKKENFSLQNNDGFCYTYSNYDARAGIRDNLTKCIINITPEAQMLFRLNQSQYFEEFKHFIESIES